MALIAEAESIYNGPETLNVWFLLAAAIADLRYIDRDLEDRIVAATRNYLPPSSSSDAQVLAGVGPLVLDLLGEVVQSSTLSEAQTVATVEVATLLNSHDALPLLKYFRSTPNAAAQQVLLNGLSGFPDPQKYVEEILEFIPSDVSLELTASSLSEFLLVRALPCITGLTPLFDLSDLRELGLLASSRIRSLNLAELPIVDLSPLSVLRQLRVLNLEETSVTTVAPLADVPGLLDLNIAHTGVGALDGVESMTLLKRLNISTTEISDLNPVRKCSGLEWLDITGTAVATLEPLSDLQNLRSLNLFDSDVRSIAHLARLPALQSVNLGATPVTTIRPLAAISTLTEIGIEATRVRDLRPLLGLRNLERVVIDGSPNAFRGGTDLDERGVLLTSGNS